MTTTAPGSTSAPALFVESVEKRFGSTVALSGATFSVGRAELVGLLGPNGAGKTTTLEIIETLREKSSGEILVDGFAARDL